MNKLFSNLEQLLHIKAVDETPTRYTLCPSEPSRKSFFFPRKGKPQRIEGGCYDETIVWPYNKWLAEKNMQINGKGEVVNQPKLLLWYHGTDEPVTFYFAKFSEAVQVRDSIIDSNDAPKLTYVRDFLEKK